LPVQNRDRSVKAGLVCLCCVLAQFALWAPEAAAGDSSSVLQPLTLQDHPFWAIDEVRAGVFDHGLEDNVGDRGVGVSAEVLGGRLPGSYGNSVLDMFLTPRPHIGTMLGFGKTDELYWGVTWDAKLFGPTFAEATFGGAAHDGALDTRGESSYGCRVNFRESFSLGYAITEHWRLLATIDHMSNGNLCHPNHGLTNAGLKLGYGF
jgi:lipid A 3-O-deacylase